MYHVIRHSGAALVLFVLAGLPVLCHAQAADFETAAKQAILADLSSNSILLEKEARSRLYPASMSKLMTVYLVFERLKDGRLSMDDSFTVSEKAWRKQGSKMFVEVGKTVKVSDLLRGIIVQSGNDACIVVAEGLAGSEETFAEWMNTKAKELGMNDSHFVNATGWPDENHYMTAYDLMLLSRHLIEDFPEYYPIFSEAEFTYSGISQPNRNLLLDKSLGVDGLKTGHTEISGYGIAISALDSKTGRRLVGVVHGTDSMAQRISEAERLLRYGLNEFEPITLFKPKQELVNVPVWLGRKEQVAAVIEASIPLTVRKSHDNSLSLKVVYQQPVPAPVREGAHIADLEVSQPGREPFSVPLYAAESVDKLGAVERILPNIGRYIFGAFSQQ